MSKSKPFMVEFSGTPEAGKTTTIGTVANMLRGKNYNVMVLRESAESLPNEIEKGTFDANMWMHFVTQAGILKAIHSQADIVLIDRGLIDSMFYGWKFLKEKKCKVNNYNEFRNTFVKKLEPDLFIALMVEPEVAIKRRGGEGRLVNKEYIETYNEDFIEFIKHIKFDKECIKTDDMDIYEMNQKIYSVVLKYLL